jgi:hypothetical protein
MLDRRLLVALPLLLAPLRARAADDPPAAAVEETAEAAPAVEAAAPAAPAAVIQADVAPSLVLYKWEGTSLALGGLLQLQLAPYVGNDSLLADGDVAQRAGFRLRRARIGFDAHFPADLRFLLVINPLSSDTETGTIAEATLSYSPRPWLRFRAGADKVPFTYGELQSSATLDTIELPLSIRKFVPDRRLGLIVDGALGGGALSYLVGVMNATEGYERGNQFTGVIYVARLQGGLGGIHAGVGGYLEDGPATTVVAASADVELAAGGAGLLAEALCDRTTPVDSPMTSPTVADKVTRCGAYAQVSYRFPWYGFQPVARLEWIDDNTDVDDAGDAWLLTAGFNARLAPHFRFQADYFGRYERFGAARANDSVVLMLQGDF